MLLITPANNLSFLILSQIRLPAWHTQETTNPEMPPYIIQFISRVSLREIHLHILRQHGVIFDHHIHIMYYPLQRRSTGISLKNRTRLCAIYRHIARRGGQRATGFVHPIGIGRISERAFYPPVEDAALRWRPPYIDSLLLTFSVLKRDPRVPPNLFKLFQGHNTWRR